MHASALLLAAAPLMAMAQSSSAGSASASASASAGASTSGGLAAPNSTDTRPKYSYMSDNGAAANVDPKLVQAFDAYLMGTPYETIMASAKNNHNPVNITYPSMADWWVCGKNNSIEFSSQFRGNKPIAFLGIPQDTGATGLAAHPFYAGWHLEEKLNTSTPGIDVWNQTKATINTDAFPSYTCGQPNGFGNGFVIGFLDRACLEMQDSAPADVKIPDFAGCVYAISNEFVLKRPNETIQGASSNTTGSTDKGKGSGASSTGAAFGLVAVGLLAAMTL